MTEADIKKYTELTLRALRKGVPDYLALAALETHLVRLLNEPAPPDRAITADPMLRTCGNCQGRGRVPNNNHNIDGMGVVMVCGDCRGSGLRRH